MGVITANFYRITSHSRRKIPKTPTSKIPAPPRAELPKPGDVKFFLEGGAITVAGEVVDQLRVKNSINLIWRSHHKPVPNQVIQVYYENSIYLRLRGLLSADHPSLTNSSSLPPPASMPQTEPDSQSGVSSSSLNQTQKQESKVKSKLPSTAPVAVVGVLESRVKQEFTRRTRDWKVACDLTGDSSDDEVWMETRKRKKDHPKNPRVTGKDSVAIDIDS